MTSYVLNHKGRKVIKTSKDFKRNMAEISATADEEVLPKTSSFTDIDFDDI
jgi:hypothetical protein